MEQGDIGCTRGGGIDAKGVFTDAGLSVSSSTGFSTKSRQGSPLSKLSKLKKITLNLIIINTFLTFSYILTYKICLYFSLVCLFFKI